MAVFDITTSVRVSDRYACHCNVHGLEARGDQCPVEMEVKARATHDAIGTAAVPGVGPPGPPNHRPTHRPTDRRTRRCPVLTLSYTLPSLQHPLSLLRPLLLSRAAAVAAAAAAAMSWYNKP
ncbi:unnamed protein product [Gadus morhua 'NCC']